jgi:hypothetical protein
LAVVIKIFSLPKAETETDLYFFSHDCLHLCPFEITDFLIIRNSITRVNESILINKNLLHERTHKQRNKQKLKERNMDYNFPILTLCFKLFGLAIYLLYIQGVLFYSSHFLFLYFENFLSYHVLLSILNSLQFRI